MDFRGLSLKMKDLIKEGDLLKHKKGGAHKYDRAVLLARMWFLEAEMFVQSSGSRIGAKSVRDFIQGIRNRSGFLLESFSTQLKDKTEMKMLELVEQVAVQLESRFLSFESEEFVGKKVRDLLYKFLVHTILLQGETLLSELLKNEIGLLPPLKTQIGSLREGLIFLQKSDINKLLEEEEDSEDKKLILAEIEGLAVGVISLRSWYSADIVTEEAVNVMGTRLSGFLRKVESLKGELTNIYLQIPKSNFPRTPGTHTIYILLEKLKQLRIHSHDSFECATQQIRAIHKDLELIVSQYNKHLFAKMSVGQSIFSQLVDDVYQVQHVIDLMELSSNPTSQQLMWLYHLSQRVQHAKNHLIGIDFRDEISSFKTLISDIDAGEQTFPHSLLIMDVSQFLIDHLKMYPGKRSEIMCRQLDKLKKMSSRGVVRVGNVNQLLIDRKYPRIGLEIMRRQLDELIKMSSEGAFRIGNDVENISKLSYASPIDNAQITPVKNIIELSYQGLSDQLKECFLYLGVFPKDKDISVKRLLWLWIAERFIEIEESKSLEDVAEDYLTGLIGSSLVIAAKRGVNGKVKTCRVPDLVLDFCLLKARDTEFSQQISSTCHDGHFEYSDPADGYRFSLCEDPEPFLADRPSGPFVRSLLFFAPDEMYPGCHRDVSFICENFKLLKVLNLESLNVGSTLDNGIDLPLHLKYLAVGGDMDSLPSSLYKLQNLETLVVKGLMNKFILLDAIWSMKKLRHIHVSNHCIFILQNDKTGSDSKLYRLVSLSMPSFPFGEEMNDILMRLPNLQKLKCMVLEPPYGSSPVCLFPDMESLRFLTSLRLSYSGRPLKAVNLNLPLSIKELTLSNFRLPWDQISALGKLPALEVLKLISRAFEGSTWELVEGEFLRLRYLKLDSLNIVFWRAAADDDCPLPFLEHLVLRNCKQLKDVPINLLRTSHLEWS